MGREDQKEEMEVLASIYPDEFKEIAEFSFTLTLALDTAEEDGPPPSFVLTVRYPEDYPDVGPDLSLSNPPDITTHPFFDLSEDKEELLQGLETQIMENMGMAMVFTLVSALKEAAEALIQSRKDAVQHEHEQKALEAERKENEKFDGQKVTRESFLKWREGFIREMEERQAKEEDERLAELKKKSLKEPLKLTGKQLWERGLAGKTEVGDEPGDEEEDTATASQGVESLKLS